MYITPSKSVLGAQIYGLDLSKSPTSISVKSIANAFTKYGVLLFPEQSLTELEQVQFAKNFCEPTPHPTNKRNRGELPEITVIANSSKGALGNNELSFHCDLAFRSKPATVSVLYCLETPLSGGETYWASNRSAFAGLKENIKNEISNLSVFYQHSLPEYNEASPVKHSLIITQPGTEAKCLYFSPCQMCIGSIKNRRK